MRSHRDRLPALAILILLPTGISLGGPRRAADSSTIVAWSETAYAIAFAEDSFRTFKGHRAFAMMHVAMHDAVNAVVPRYRPLAFFGRDSLADPAVAAAQAAHDVLREAYPNAGAVLTATLARTLPQNQKGASTARGLTLGRKAAAAIIEARRGDGFAVQGTYAFRKQIGAYRTTPPWNGFVVQPGFRHARPFGLTAPGQFRPPAPPPTGSTAYARDLDEVQGTGGIRSAARSADQTAYAVWWMEFSEGAINRLARRLAIDRHLPLADAARLFALINVSLYDSYVAVWDSKYEHDHWRPYTAIREAAHDDNAATRPDTAWEPLRPTPPFPEYVSAHAAGCAASLAILAHVLGDGAFEMETITAPASMPRRSFASFRSAAAECADSRVRLGWHFRYSTDAGLELGNAVARYVAKHHLTPIATAK